MADGISCRYAKKYINTEAYILFVSIIHEKNIICDTILQFLGRKSLFFQNGMRYNTSMVKKCHEIS